jgi:NADH:ubiquinone oxidoreductase subunit H
MPAKAAKPDKYNINSFYVVICVNCTSWFTNIYYINYSILIIFVLIRSRAFVILIIGWRSNSVFSLMDSVHLAQSISCEVRFIFIICCLIILSERYSLGNLIAYLWIIYIIYYILYIWNIAIGLYFFCFFIRILAEINKKPIDFVEGER